MRQYELMTIATGSLDEMSVSGVIDRFRTLIDNQGGRVERIDHWGKRQFAYEINHMTEGYYTVIDLQISSDGLLELERQLGLADEIVRYKIVRPAVRTKRSP